MYSKAGLEDAVGVSICCDDLLQKVELYAYVPPYKFKHTRARARAHARTHAELSKYTFVLFFQNIKMIYMRSIRTEELLILATVICYLNTRKSPLRLSGTVAGYEIDKTTSVFVEDRKLISLITK
jgi:hypothetical protein